MDSAQEELALVQAAASGDAAALKLLLLDGHARLCMYIGHRIPADLRGFLEPEDLAQEAYIQVFRNIGTFRAREPDSFRRWITTIALRKLRNAIKARRAAKRGGGKAAVAGAPTTEDSMVNLFDLVAAPGRSPSQSVARHDAVQAVQVALAVLPDHYREAVSLVYVRGCSVAEAAARLGRTERAIHGLCRNGLRLLRERLGSASRFLSSSD